MHTQALILAALEEIEIGKQVFERGVTSGIEPHAWDSLRRTGIFLKAPITTPQGKGYKSLNVTTRKALGLYANVRPAKSYAPAVASAHPGMNVVVIRENEEDLYAGIELGARSLAHREGATQHVLVLSDGEASEGELRPDQVDEVEEVDEGD